MLSRSIEYKNKVAFVYLIAFFLDLLNTYIATVAFPRMGQELHATEAQLSWILNAYILGLTLIIPVSGWLGDKYGTKKIFLVSISVFTMASFFSGFFKSIDSLIFFRLLQGLGGGLLIPVGQTMLFRQFLAEERTKILGAILIPATIAPMIAPAVGGFIVQYFHWSFIFYLNVPFGLGILALSAYWLIEEKQEISHRIDLPGLGLLSVSLFSILYACYLFSSINTITNGIYILLTSIVLIFTFVFYVLKKRNPVLDLRLLKHKGFGIFSLIYFMNAFSVSGINILSVYFFQNALGISPEKTGMLMIPFGIGIISGLKCGSFLVKKFSSHQIIALGLVGYALASFGFLMIQSSSQYNMALSLFFILGCGSGLASRLVQSEAFHPISNKEMGKATALFNLTRQLGLSLGAGITMMLLSLFLIFNNISHDHTLHRLVTGINTYHLCFLFLACGSLMNLIFLKLSKSN